MLKRFCDSCNKEMKNIYLDVMITPKDGKNDDGKNNYYGDFCVECVKQGEATKVLITEYREDQLQVKSDKGLK